MKTRGLSLKLMDAAPRPSLATATGPVFAMLDPPGVPDAHGDTMDAGALRLPDGISEVPLYWVHSYHEGVVPKATPEQRLPIGSATVWEEGGQWYFVPRFNHLTDLSKQVSAAVAAGEVTACSIGYLTVRGTPNDKGPDGKGEDVHEARLLEASLVDKGAKESAVRVKAMADETTECPGCAAVRADVAAMKAMVTAMHEQAFPKEAPAPKAKEEAPPPAEEEKPKDEQPPPAEDEEPVTKWLRSFAA
ncbi:HK97 family phage prohead protease [Archangium lansingense]|uniref:HK97 family phage prohead protease n=1 Tax=Archangium lansingense TaxID=2995310 RepID=A0ABT4AF88_9BACT|nr:HK97 family phage prohead protease [Archangium lansinium]MCY1080290.1 HK97 family phage prohead protease [Archangium lansinium]